MPAKYFSRTGFLAGWLASVFICLWGGLALAQDVSDYVKISPVPDWVVPVSIPEFDTNDYKERESVWPLVDYQKRINRTTEDFTYRYVVDLMSSAAVEEQGTITIDFDPSYETLRLHDISLIRDGQTLDAIDLSEAMVFRTETDRDQMIFNGTLTFSMPILDLRVGDRLSVQYSRNGRNPAIGEGFLVRRNFGTNYELKRRFIRVLIDEDMDAYTKSINDAPEPDVSVSDGWQIYQWDVPDPQEPDYDDNMPAWAYPRPTYEISNFESWADVGDSFAAYYTVDDAARSAVAPIVEEIAANFDTSELRARAALDWVQENIRYVGLELGEGGFIPRPPARVLRRRFGDCKDVTLLLLSLLDGLGVDADPILVNLSERGGEFGGLPHPYAFDHIKVLAEIDGQIFPLDATRDPQIGTLGSMEKGSITKGLRLIETGSVVTELPKSKFEFREVIKETFDLVSDSDAILYTLVFEEYGVDADDTLAWIASDGEADVVDGFVRYLKDIYPTLEVDRPMEWESDEDKAMTRMTFSFRLPGYRGAERTKLYTRAYQILSAVPNFEGGTRDAPFEIDHPRRIHHVRHYIGDENYTFEPGNRYYESDAFRFDYQDTVEGDTLTEDYRWVTKSDHIAPDSFEADMAKIEKIRDLSYTTMNLPGEVSADATEEETGIGAKILAWLILIGFPAGLLWHYFRNRRSAAQSSESESSST